MSFPGGDSKCRVPSLSVPTKQKTVVSGLEHQPQATALASRPGVAKVDGESTEPKEAQVIGEKEHGTGGAGSGPAANWWETEVFEIPPPPKQFGYKWSEGFVAPFLSSSEAVVRRGLEVAVQILEAKDASVRPFVLDLGCGDGEVVLAAAQMGLSGVGIDIDESLLVRARNRAASFLDRTQSPRRPGPSRYPSSIDQREPEASVTAPALSMEFFNEDLLSASCAARIAAAPIVYIYLLPGLFTHHPELLARLADARDRGAVVLSMRWPLAGTDWEERLVRTVQLGVGGTKLPREVQVGGLKEPLVESSPSHQRTPCTPGELSGESLVPASACAPSEHHGSVTVPGVGSELSLTSVGSSGLAPTPSLFNKLPASSPSATDTLPAAACSAPSRNATRRPRIRAVASSTSCSGSLPPSRSPPTGDARGSVLSVSSPGEPRCVSARLQEVEAGGGVRDGLEEPLKNDSSGSRGRQVGLGAPAGHGAGLGVPLACADRQPSDSETARAIPTPTRTPIPGQPQAQTQAESESSASHHDSSASRAVRLYVYHTGSVDIPKS